ncbi:MAG: hypothetical protein ACXAC5_02965 [Promethearchaeota archaeon]
MLVAVAMTIFSIWFMTVNWPMAIVSLLGSLGLGVLGVSLSRGYRW